MNTAVKRIRADIRELQKHASPLYYAEPVEDNLFEWHFTIRGPADTDFEDGIYHGRIVLPSDYPFKPPNFVFLTPNGRFAVNEKICLTISAHHPEYWQPAWGIRLILEALISFFPTEGGGALGALDWPSAERRKLAAASADFTCRHCGRVADLLPEPGEGAEAPEAEPSPFAAEIAQLIAGSVTARADAEEKTAPPEEEEGKARSTDTLRGPVEAEQRAPDGTVDRDHAQQAAGAHHRAQRHGPPDAEAAPLVLRARLRVSAERPGDDIQNSPPVAPRVELREAPPELLRRAPRGEELHVEDLEKPGLAEELLTGLARLMAFVLAWLMVRWVFVRLA